MSRLDKEGTVTADALTKLLIEKRLITDAVYGEAIGGGRGIGYVAKMP